jgi:hypothetical protein
MGSGASALPPLTPRLLLQLYNSALHFLLYPGFYHHQHPPYPGTLAHLEWWSRNQVSLLFL